GQLSLDIREIIVGAGEGEIDLRYGANICAKLTAEHPFVMAGRLAKDGSGIVEYQPGVEISVEDRERPGSGERRDSRPDLVFALSGKAVETEIAMVDEIGRTEERIVETSGLQRQFVPCAIPDESTIEPDAILAEIAARAAERRVEGDGRIAIARAEAQ